MRRKCPKPATTAREGSRGARLAARRQTGGADKARGAGARGGALPGPEGHLAPAQRAASRGRAPRAPRGEQGPPSSSLLPLPSLLRWILSASLFIEGSICSSGALVASCKPGVGFPLETKSFAPIACTAEGAPSSASIWSQFLS